MYIRNSSVPKTLKIIVSFAELKLRKVDQIFYQLTKVAEIIFSKSFNVFNFNLRRAT